MNFKIVLVGDGGVGKSVWLKRHISGQFEPKYIATLGVEVYPINFNTNYGTITFNVWDTAGQAKFGGLRDGYYAQAKGFIVFADYTNYYTLNHTKNWTKDVLRIVNNAPGVLVANKCDIPDNNKKFNVEELGQMGRELELPMYEISAKTNYQYEKPFLVLARQLTGKEDLVFC